MQAVENGEEETVDCLLYAGARVDIHDSNGNTPLILVGIYAVQINVIVVSANNMEICMYTLELDLLQLILYSVFKFLSHPRFIIK